MKCNAWIDLITFSGMFGGSNSLRAGALVPLVQEGHLLFHLVCGRTRPRTSQALTDGGGRDPRSGV